MVIINDDLSQEVNSHKISFIIYQIKVVIAILFKEVFSSSSSEKDPLSINGIHPEVIQKIGPEVSIIPVERKKPSFKIRLFNKEYSPTDDDSETVHNFARYLNVLFKNLQYLFYSDFCKIQDLAVIIFHRYTTIMSCKITFFLLLREYYKSVLTRIHFKPFAFCSLEINLFYLFNKMEIFKNLHINVKKIFRKILYQL